MADDESDYASDVTYSGDGIDGKSEPSQRKEYSEAPAADAAAGTPRVVKINNHDGNRGANFAGNSIHTSKYTVLTFLPKNLFEQFSKLANLYFLVIALLTTIPTISPVASWSSFLPLAFVVIVSAIREAIEDFQRHRTDNHINNQIVEVLDASSRNWSEKKWRNVVCGDIVKIKKDTDCPADVMLLASSDKKEGLAYIETANLDGETNFKRRMALAATRAKGDDPNYLLSLQGELEYEQPNNRLYVFNGKLTLKGQEMAVSNDQILLRGTKLRNTAFANGLVVYTGHDTKVMMNSTDASFKRSKVDKLMSRYIVVIIIFQFFLILACAIAAGVWYQQYGKTMPFLLIDAQASAPFYGFTSFFTFLILISALIPISLYVSIELVKVVQSLLINFDGEMYYDELDRPAKARTSTLTEELGQIKYVFTDKTGTLTQNRMQFMKMTCNGRKYGTAITETAKAAMLRGEIPMGGGQDDEDEGSGETYGSTPYGYDYNEEAEEQESSAGAEKSKEASAGEASKDGEYSPSGSGDDDPDAIVDFDEALFNDLDGDDEQSEQLGVMMELLAVCNTVIPEKAKEKKGHTIWRGLNYSGASPDEAALVKAAAQFKYRMLKRTADVVTIEMRDGSTQDFELLNTLEFSSDRKRMSNIVRMEDGTIRMFTKGADSVIFERVESSGKQGATKKHLDQFALEGLRTLVCAYKDIDDGEYESWNRRWEEASKAVFNRDKQLDKLSDEMEQDLTLLGAVAIEDKLQEGVPTTISILAKARINMWVLTGDKQETAINIAYASALLGQDMNLLKLNETSRRATTERMKELVKEYSPETNRLQGRPEKNALVIDGQTLSFVLARKQTQDLMYDIGKTCVSVIFCRVSPLQKAQVVQLVRARSPDITLAIGDGANDVSMIKEAHVGVGIAGVEGTQALMAADYAFGQFRFLLRLLLVHGRWSYRRITMLILYSFYKNFAFNLTQIWFNIWAGMSGQTYIDQFYVSTFNLFYTALPPLFFAVFDQDTSARANFLFPQLYISGQQDGPFNLRVFGFWLLDGLYASFVLFFIPYGFFYNNIGQSNGRNDGMFYEGALTYFCIIVAVNVRLMIMTKYWSPFNHVAVYFCIFAWPAVSMVFHANVTFGTHFSIYEMFGSASFYFVVFITAALANFPAFIISYLQQTFWPTPQDVVLKLNISPDPRVPLSRVTQMHLAEARNPGKGMWEAYRKVKHLKKNKKQGSHAHSSHAHGSHVGTSHMASSHVASSYVGSSQVRQPPAELSGYSSRPSNVSYESSGGGS